MQCSTAEAAKFSKNSMQVQLMVAVDSGGAKNVSGIRQVQAPSKTPHPFLTQKNNGPGC